MQNFVYQQLLPNEVCSVERPEDYRWNSLGDYIRTDNQGNFLSPDVSPVRCAQLALRELHRASLKDFGMLDADERLKRYRRYVYEVGAVNRSGKPAAGVIDTGGLGKTQGSSLHS